MRTRCLAVIWAAAIGVGLSMPALAQEGTAAAEPSASCEAVEPRDAEFFAELALSQEATPQDAAEGQEVQDAQGSPAPVELPDGEAADETTTADVAALYATLIDCLNRADYLRAYALYSEEYLLANLSAETISQLEATPVPAEESTRTEFGGVLEARVRDDGAVVALVTTSNPNTGEVLIRTTMTREDEGLRIADEVIIEAETPATPAG